VPYLERAQKAFGWNYKTVKSFDDMRAQMKFFRGGDSKNLENAARSLGLSFVMVGRSFDPLASHGAKPLFSNEAYAVYGLRP
jgi:hypothetical protein